MIDIEYHKELVSIIGAIEDAYVDASFIEVNFSDEVLSKCNCLNIKTEIIQTKMRLFANSILTKVFDSVDTFLKIKEINSQSNLLIYNNGNIVSYINENTFLDFQEKCNYYLIKNTKTFLEFQSFLKEQENEVDGTFHFVDSYNKDSRKIVFVSLSEKSRLQISYDLESPLFNEFEDFSKGFRRYTACFVNENSSLLTFLKSATINLVSNYDRELRFKQYFENLNEIVDKAKMNFEVYLNELSIDKIKKDYDDVKSKYFNGLSDMLSKLSQNIIALPIGIAAILFAIEKIKNEQLFICLLIIVILITSIYLSLILKLHLKDLFYIQKVFYNDYKLLIGNSFFRKYPQESALFDEIKDRIKDRVKFLKLIIESYFWIMNLANLFILGLLLSYLKLSATGIIIILIPILFLILIARNNILDEIEEDGKKVIL